MESTQERPPLKAVVRAARKAFLTVAVFSLFINLLVLTVPVYMIQVFDRVMTSRSEETLLVLTLAALAALGIMAALDFVRSRILVRIGLWLDRSLSPSVLSAAMNPDAYRGMRCAQPVRDLSLVRNFLTGSGIFALLDAPWVPLFIALVFVLHPTLGIVALLGAGLLFGLGWLNEVLTRAPLNAASTAAIRGMAAADTMVRQAETVQGLGMSAGLTAWWVGQNAQALDRQAEASDRAGTIMALTKFLRLALQVSILGLAAQAVVQQQISIGAMIAASIILTRALAPVEQSIATWRNLVSARAAFGRLKPLLEKDHRQVHTPLPTPKGVLKAVKLSFAPARLDEPVFSDVSFVVEPGQLFAITGPSGAGKSSLVRMLIGVDKPARGKVRLDGADVYAWSSGELGRHIGYMPQTVELLPGTVRQNIARFSDADPRDVFEAAQKAGIHDLILELPDGYDTVVGSGHEVLSVGTRQRIALARALFRGPGLLVLDEPYSNLDAEGVKSLMTAINDLKERGATIVIVAHRPSILAHADRVMLLENGAGRIVEKSKRADLKVLSSDAPPPPQPVPAEDTTVVFNERAVEA